MVRKQTKKFIKPGEGKKFKLVNRSIRDLGGYVDGAGQNVLASINEAEDETHFENLTTEERLQMQKEHGIEFGKNDDYNYLQHLKQRSAEATEWVSAAGSVVSVTRSGFGGRANSRISGVSRTSHLTTSSRISAQSLSKMGKFFETEDEIPEGHFQQLAAERFDMPFDFDPEVAAQLDGDDDDDMIVNPDEEDVDDFDDMIMAANESCSEDEDEYEPERIGNQEGRNFLMERFGLGGVEGEANSDEDDREYDAEEEEDEKKSRFTAYSMSSSIMRRSVKLENLDDHFEEMFAKYDDEEIGDLPQKNLEDNEIELDSELLATTMQKDYEEFVPEQLNAIDFARRLNMTEDVTKYLADREKWDSDEEGDYEMQETKPKPKWDCETICSTYSNLYNRPKVVEDGFSVRTGKVKTSRNRNVMFGSALKELESEYQAERKDLKARPQARQKGETIEEKKARKQLVKLGKKERREEKKETQYAFSKEYSEIIKRDAGQSIKLN